MNKHYRPHIGGYSQTEWEIQTTWESRGKVAKAGLMVSGFVITWATQENPAHTFSTVSTERLR